MKWLLILSFFYAIPVFAQHKSCDHDHGLLSEDLKHLIEWFGATNEQIANAPCKTSKIPSQKEMLDLINKSISTKKASKDIHEVQFKDESLTMLEAFEDMTSAKDAFGISLVPENQLKIQDTYNINPACEKVLCAVKKIWGDEGVKMLYIKLKHGYNTSELTFQNSDKFENKELDDVILGLEDLPKHLTPLGDGNKRLTKFKRGYTLNGYGSTVIANAVVMLFDAWSEQPGIERQYTIFHEAGHNIGTLLDGLDKSTPWLDVSGWEKKGDDWTSNGGCFVSKYGETNPAEDFAESVTTFRYSGKAFKDACPEKYNFIKKHVYKDLEYTSVEACTLPAKEKIAAAKNKLVNSIIQNKKQASFEKQNILKSCKESFSGYPIPKEEISKCSLEVQFQGQLKTDLTKILQEEGLQDNQINRDMIKTELDKDLESNPLLVNSIHENSKELLTSIDKMVEESLPKTFDEQVLEDKMSFIWYDTVKKCGESFFGGSKEEIQKCQITQALLYDQQSTRSGLGNFPSLALPSVFKASVKEQLLPKHNEQMTKLLLEQEKMQNIFSKQNIKFIDDFSNHRDTVGRELRKMSGWNKMEPQEFCEKTYAKGSVWLYSYGFSDGKPIPALIEKCTSAQSKKSKRFEFSKQEWEELIK